MTKPPFDNDDDPVLELSWRDTLFIAGFGVVLLIPPALLLWFR